MHQLWILLSAAGDSRLLLPAAMLAMCCVAMSDRPPAIKWFWAFGMACALVLASKLAFLGWGLGWAAIDFTGFSGHSMVSAAIYPVLGYAMGNIRSRRWGVRLALGGTILAVMIAISRVVLSAHSVSEVLLGLVIGFTVSGMVVARWQAGRGGVRMGTVALGFLLSALATHSVAPQVRSHDVVVALALALSGATTPYTRESLHRGSQGN